MDNMLKRLLSFAVALFMVIGLMPWNAASVYATEEDVPAETPTVEETVEAAETVAAVTFECKHCDEEVEWLPLNADTVADYYTGATSAQLNANTHNSFENGHYYLTADTAVQGIDLRTGGDVVIELNGFALSNSSGRMFRLAGSSKVTIQGTGKVVPMKNYTMGTVAYVSGSSTFAMYGGTLDGANVYTYSGSTTEKGGAIRMESSGKEVTLNGVTIVNCKTGTSGGNSGTGGVLSMSTGTANIIGCTISNCSSVKQGGAIHANGGTVNLTNSTISGCSAINGGAAYIMGGATFNVTNSKIESCSASTNGGAIYGGGSSAKVVINSGSEITDCSATTAGGGVYLTTNTALTMNGGKITGCTAAQEGAAVRQNSTTTTFTMNGGEISGNESTNSDAGSGGVRVYGTFDMTGGTIKNNPGGTSNDSEIAISGVADGVSVAVCNISGDAVVTSEDTTNAICAFKGTLNMTGGTVNGNVVVSNPHYDDEGNLTDNGGTATISGGTVNGVVHAFTNDKDESGEITITGGTYSGDVTAFLAEGYVQYPNGKVGLPCTEHTYDEGVETKAPTCGNPGVKTFTCTNCGATTTEEIAPTGEHEYMYACDATCKNCGELTNPDAAHSTKHVDAVAATIGATGNVEYWYCEYCGTVWTDAALTQQSNRFNVITPALEAVAQVGETEYATLGEAIAADGEITLLANIETDAAFVIDSVEVLNLNGFSVSTTENDTVGDGVFTVVSGGDLTINGEGTINGVGGNDYNIAIWANGGKVTINGGTYTNVGATDSTGDTHFDLIYVKNGGEVVINGGTFIAESPAWTLNKHDGTRDDCTIAVYGGTFYGFDVDDNAAEGAGTDFCADGYHAYEDGEYYTVHEITRRYACDGNCSTCYENVTPGEHVIGHVEAVEATCQSMGNIEYWYCEACEGVWSDEALTQITNHQSVKTGYGDHKYSSDCDVTCNTCDEETREALAEHAYRNPCDGYCMNCYELTNPDAAHSIVHVEAKAGTDCLTWDGNIEYWTCEYCNQCWDNAEGTGFTMNPMMIKVPGDHKYENGVCSVCGEEDPDYVPELFNLSGSNMKLGGTLEINFFINISNLEGTDNYAVITKVYADGRDDVVKTVNQEDWKPYGNNLYYCSFVVSAKEMTDDLTVIVYNAEGQQVSNEYVDSVAAYGVRMLRKTSVAKEQRVYVDMLNYGAAAQTEFEYHLDKMANAELTADELAYGTQSVEMTNILEKGTGYAGTSLSLKENILFNVFYQKSVLDQAANAKVTYTDHYGNAEEYTIQASEFKAYGSSLGYIEFSDMGVADCSQPITITLYNAEGAELSKTIESAESYAARNSTSDDDIYAMVMKFAAGAYNYFHPSN